MNDSPLYDSLQGLRAGELTYSAANTGRGKSVIAAVLAARALKDGNVFYVNRRRVSSSQDVVDILNGDFA